MKKFLGGLLVLILFISTSCIFGPSIKKVMSYRDGWVYMSDKTHYTVGSLPASWERMRVPAYSIAFHNPLFRTTIATDAFCEKTANDLSLNILTNHLVTGVENFDRVSSKEFWLDERGALRTLVTGTVEGVPLAYDVVVIKKNGCVFDFMCISPLDMRSSVSADFEKFYEGFHYE